jgi:hypothetical protein
MVKELSHKVKVLTVENQSLLAEVEIYRNEAALPNFSNLALGKAPSTDGMEVDETPDEFIRSGNKIFPSDNAATLNGLHMNANILCCDLNHDDTLLATGGADRGLTLCQWGGALAPTPGAADTIVKEALRLDCAGPVICAAFAQDKALPVVAAGYVFDLCVYLDDVIDCLLATYNRSNDTTHTQVYGWNRHAYWIWKWGWWPAS